MFSVWHGSLTASCRCECHSVVSSRRSEPPRRTLAWLPLCVSTAQRRGASVDRRDRVVTWRCRSSSMHGGTECDRALCVMTAILYWMRCWTDSQWRDFNSGLAWTHLQVCSVVSCPESLVLSRNERRCYNDHLQASRDCQGALYATVLCLMGVRLRVSNLKRSYDGLYVLTS